MTAVKEDNDIKKIYRDIYLKDPDFSINIFLCGAETVQTKSIRTTLNSAFENHPRFNVVLPEWLFSSLDEKEFNLLHLERQLAEYVDVVVLPLEGTGAIAELGAFAMNKELVSKIIVINDKKFKYAKSFINMGPVEVIRSNNKSNIEYFSRDEYGTLVEEEKFAGRIVAKLQRFPKSTATKSELTNLFNLSRFLLFLIAIYQPVKVEEIKSLLSQFKEGNAVPQHIIQPAVDILLQKHNVVRELEGESYGYKLSESGHKFVFEELLGKLNVVRVFSRIRAKRVNEYYRKSNKFVSEVGVNKFLEMINA